MTSLPAPFAIRVDRQVGAAVRIEVVGELDLSTAPELEHALRREIASGNEIVLDLGAVTFIDSTGLHTIVSALRLTDEAEPAFSVSPMLPSQVRRVLEITGLNEVIPVASE
jgi:anti-anti-sigma factor